MAEKTVFPGMPTGEPVAPQMAPKNNKSTVFPGMPEPSSDSAANGKPLLGFLYSVSRTPYGEFWPLYVGPNTIGRDLNNVVSLPEKTVSSSHATLVIRKMQQNGASNGIFVFIQDTGSTTGTMLNGNTLGFQPQECKSGDVITIGGYELYLILVDPETIGLHVNEDFQAMAAPAPVPVPSVNPFDWKQGPDTANGPKEFKGTLPGTGFGAPNAGGAFQSAANPFDNKKATIYMPNKK